MKSFEATIIAMQLENAVISNTPRRDKDITVHTNSIGRVARWRNVIVDFNPETEDIKYRFTTKSREVKTFLRREMFLEYLQSIDVNEKITL